MTLNFHRSNHILILVVNLIRILGKGEIAVPHLITDGAIPALVQLIDNTTKLLGDEASGDLASKRLLLQHGAAALANIAQDATGRTEILASRAPVLLVQVLARFVSTSASGDGSGGGGVGDAGASAVTAKCAAALANIARLPSSRPVLVDAGVISPLVQLVRVTSANMKEQDE